MSQFYTTAYLASDGYEVELQRELADAGIVVAFEHHGLLITASPPVASVWAANIWHDVVSFEATSIGDAARGLRFALMGEGVRVERGTAAVSRVDARELSGPAVGLHGPGFAAAHDLSAPGGQAMVAEAGHAHLSGRTVGIVGVGSEARLCVAASAVPLERRSWARAFVLVPSALVAPRGSPRTARR